MLQIVRVESLALAMHISNCRQEINTYTLAHAPLSLLTVTRGTLAAYHDHMETEVDFGSWTLVETVAWAKKAFGDDVSASFEGLRKCYDVHAHVMHMYICMHVHSAVERGGKGVDYPGPRGTKGAPRSLRIIFFFQLCATTVSSSIEH